MGGRNDARKIGAVMVVEIAVKNRCAAAEEIPAMEVVDITVLVVVAPILLFNRGFYKCWLKAPGFQSGARYPECLRALPASLWLFPTLSEY